MYTASKNVFVCHASEDKDAIARPLAEALRKKRFKVWYDEFSLNVGDSLLKAIGRGLSNCDYGIVIFSPISINKYWTEAEISGLFNRESKENRKIILPVLHNISVSELNLFNPILSDRLAIDTKGGVNFVVKAIMKAVYEDQILRRSSYFEYYGKQGGKLSIRAMSNSGSDTSLFDATDIENLESDINLILKKLVITGKLTKKIGP